MLFDVSNVLYNTGLLSLDPSEAPHGGSVDGHVLVPDAIASVFFIPAPAAVFLGAVGSVARDGSGGAKGCRRRATDYG